MRMPLTTYIAQVALTPIINKRLIGKPYVLMGQFFFRSQLIFESGMLLGYRYRNRILDFAKLFTTPGKEEDFVSYSHGLIKEHVDKLTKAESLMDIYLMPELERLKIDFFIGLPKIAMRKIDFEKVFQNAEFAAAKGVVFGCYYPNLTEQLWKNTYETPTDIKSLNEFIQAGLIIDDTPKQISIEQGQQNMLPLLEEYIRTYRPEASGLLQ